MSPLFEAILFDLDGTLLDSVPLIVASYAHTLAAHGLPVPSDAEIRASIGPPLDVHFAQWVDDPAVVQAMIDTYRRFNLAAHDRIVRPFPGVSEALDHLGSARLGIVTSKLTADAKRGLACLGLSHWFEVLVCREDVEPPKPDPAPVRFALHRMGVPPERAAYVGDTVGDLVSGRTAGVFTVAVTWGVADRAALAAVAPDALVSDAAGLLAALTRG